ncbi:MAG: hypothetical protein KJ069_02035 [Anaerolineae bacterium]|nr:hypothetical protein [Anaerolineae bacterium]
MNAPVNVKPGTPTGSIHGWAQEAADWTRLNSDTGGNPDFFPLTVKAIYVIGVIYDLCESVGHLLRHPTAEETTYIPAYGVFASGVELLGRCINGNTSTRSTALDLATGFKWLASSSYSAISDTHVLIATSSFSYTIDMLTALRHFAAHGQATSNITSSGTYKFGNIDYEILSQMPPLIADGLERYWSQLQNDDDLCNMLAQANIIALRNWPVFRSLSLFEKNEKGMYHSITEIFNRFNWHV